MTGKSGRQETPYSWRPLSVPRNTIREGRRADFPMMKKGRLRALFLVRAAEATPDGLNMCRMPNWKERLSSPGAVVQPPT